MGAEHKVGEITKAQLIDLYVSMIAFTMPVVGFECVGVSK